MLDRRGFLGGVVAGALVPTGWGPQPSPGDLAATHSRPASRQGDVRGLFPRLERDVYLNGAGGTPLGRFARRGMERLLDFYADGPDGGRVDYFRAVFGGVRARFADLVGAEADEIGWVDCTKRGEQMVLDGLDVLRRGTNVVTTDLHFSGSLHNLEGLRRRGVDVRVVPVDASFQVSAERVVDAMDGDTALLCLSLVSNVTGDVAPIAALSAEARARGALVFADIIQAAGCISVDLPRLGVDVAACSSYKWLHGVHGAGFLYVRQEVQGGLLPDRMVPGTARRSYAPWFDGTPEGMSLDITPREDARRYEPGHVSYVGYAAAYEGLGFLAEQGGAVRAQEHTAALLRDFVDALDGDRYEVLTNEPGRTPILALRAASLDGLADRLVARRVVISLAGDADGLIRISPGLYNDADDMDRLLAVLHA